MRMGQLIIDVGLQLAKLIDQYLAFRGSRMSPGQGLHDIISRSCCHKGRLLHYKSLHEGSLQDEQRWCGLHTDHGSLTGVYVWHLPD